MCNLLVSLQHLELRRDVRRYLKDIRNLQRSGPECLTSMELIKTTDNKDLVHQHNGIWFQREKNSEIWRLVVPKSIQKAIVTSEHERIGHGGLYKTSKQIGRNFWWKNMSKDIKPLVLSCDLCQRVKHLNRNLEGPYDHICSENPGDLATVDFYGPLPRSLGGVEYIFVVLDSFSKYVKLYPIKRANTRTVLKKILVDYVQEVGKPRRILADNGTQFRAIA